MHISWMYENETARRNKVTIKCMNDNAHNSERDGINTQYRKVWRRVRIESTVIWHRGACGANRVNFLFRPRRCAKFTRLYTLTPFKRVALFVCFPPTHSQCTRLCSYWKGSRLDWNWKMCCAYFCRLCAQEAINATLLASNLITI